MVMEQNTMEKEFGAEIERFGIKADGIVPELSFEKSDHRSRHVPAAN